MHQRSLAAFLHHSASFSKELRVFTISAILFRTAESLLIIALPVFLYRFANEIPGFSALPFSDFQKGVLAICLYLMLPRILYLAVFPFLLKALKLLGLAKSMTLGFLFATLLMASITFLPQMPELFYILPFFRFASLFFYWLPYHLLLSTETKITQVGRQLGTLEFMVRLSGLLAPLMGTLISAHFGFSSTFLLSISLFLLGAIFASGLKNITTKHTWSWSDFRALWSRPIERLNMIAAGGLLWESIGLGVFWPVYLSLSYQSITAAGYFLATAGFISLLFTYLSGWVYDHRKKPSLFARLLGTGLSLLWIPRALWSHSPFVVVAADVSENILGSMYTTVFSSSLIRQSRKNNIFLYYANYEVTVCLTMIVGISAVLILLFTTWSWPALFLSFLGAGLLSLTFRFAKRE